MANRTVSVALKLLIGDYVGAAEKASQSTEGIGESAKRSAGQHKAGMDSIVRGTGVAALAGAAGLGAITSASMGFGKAMSGVAAVSDATGAELQQLSDLAIKAGADTSFSASEAAQAEAELAKAGVSTSDILGGALRGSLDLAAAGQLDLADAATISANAMNIFGLKGNQVGHIADVLAAGANKSAADVDGLAQAMAQGGQVAGSLGLSLKDTVGALSLFADSGLKGSDAGTSLKTALQMLAAPAGPAAEMMKELGHNASDAAGNFVGLANFSGQLQDKLGKLTQEQRANALATIFGADAVRVANILYKEGSAGVAEYTKAVDDQGAAGRMAAKQLDNLAGDVEQLGGSIETALIQGGSGANGVLRALTQTATGMVNTFGSAPAPLQATAVGLLAIGTGVAGAISVIGTIGPKVRTGREELRSLGTTGQRADAVLGKLGRTAGIAAAGFAAFEVAAFMLGKLQDALVDTPPMVEQLTTSLLHAEQAGDVTRALTLDADGLGAAVKEIVAPDTEAKLRRFFSAPLGKDPRVLREAKGNVNALDQALAQLVASGNGAEAARQYQLIVEAAGRGGASVDQVKKALPGYAEALAKVGNDATLAAAGQKKAGATADEAVEPVSALEQAARGLGVEFKETTTAAELAKTAIDRLNGVNLSALDTDIAYRESLAGVTEAIKTNGRTLDINTGKGRANLSAVADAIKAASTHAQAVADQSGSVDKGTAVFGAHIRQLRQAAIAAGLPKAAVEALIAQYAKVPGKVETRVSAPGAKTSADAVKGHNTQAGLVPRTKATQVSAPGAVDAAGKMTRVTQAANGIPASKTVWVAVHTAAAAAQVRAISGALAGLHDRTVTVRVVRASINNGVDGVLPSGGYASGTDSAPPGWAWVGEQGPELMRFRGGEQVLNAARSASVAASYAAAPGRQLQPAGVPAGPNVSVAAGALQLHLTGAPGMTPAEVSTMLDGALARFADRVAVEAAKGSRA